MRPVVHGMEAEYWGQVDFVYLDRENAANSAMVERFGIRSQPIFILLDAQGSEVQRWFGAVSPDSLRLALNAALAG